MFGNKKRIIIKLLVILFIVFNLLIAIGCIANAKQEPIPIPTAGIPTSPHDDNHMLIRALTSMCFLFNSIILLIYIISSLMLYKKVKIKTEIYETLLIFSIYTFMTLESGSWINNILVDGIEDDEYYVDGSYIMSIIFMILMAISSISIIIKIINNFIKINKMKKEEKPKCQE